jgi:hypothetical protein
LTIIFAPTKHLKIPKSFSRKSFYAETNGALKQNNCLKTRDSLFP